MTFTDLENELNIQKAKHVKIRGFLYQQPDGTLILAAQPNLKSCCVGAKVNIHQQIVVQTSSKLDLVPYAINLEGFLKKEPQYDEKGELVHLYVLNDAHFLVEERSYFLWTIAMGIVVGLILYIVRPLLLKVVR